MANVVWDQFAGTGSLTSHTADSGASWALNSFFNTGTLTLNGNGSGRVRTNTSNQSWGISSAAPSSTDYRVSCELYFASLVSGDFGGILLRADPAAQTAYKVFWRQSTGLVQIDNIVANTSHGNLGNAAVTVNAGERHHLACQISGTNPVVLNVYWDGRPLFTVTDTNNYITTAGRSGILLITTGGAATDTTNVQVDNFICNDLTGFAAYETVWPANHGAGSFVAHLTGVGTAWVQGTTTWTVGGSLGGWTLSGSSISSNTSATVTLSCPAAASPPTGTTGIVTISDGSTTTAWAVETPNLEFAPTSGPPGTPITATGGMTWWTKETPAGLFTAVGSNAPNALTPGVAADQKSYLVLTFSGAATVTVADSSTGAQATFSGTTSKALIQVNDANWYSSPYNWYANSPNYVQSTCPGAYIKLNFTGTSGTLILDTSPMELGGVGTTVYPKIRYMLNDGGAIDYQLVAGTESLSIGTGLAGSPNTLVVYFLAHDESEDVWNTPNNIIKVVGLQVDSGASSAAVTTFPKNVLCFGDSMWEAAKVLNNTSYVAGQDSTSSMCFGMAWALNGELGLVAFGHQGWCTTGNGNIPPFFTPGNDSQSSWNKHFKNQTRLVAGRFSPLPDYIFINFGHNDTVLGVSDATITAAVTPLLTAMRAAAPGTPIIVVLPYPQTTVSAVTNGVNNYLAATPDPNCYLINPQARSAIGIGSLGSPTYESYDGTHYNIQHQGYAAALTMMLVQQALTGPVFKSAFALGGAGS
jgi:hypothetical protein